MVIALLLSDPNKLLLRQDLGRVAIQCLHGVHSMWKALSIFQSALSYERSETAPATSSTPLRLLSAFDAQVGDCACQLRAQMLWELVQCYGVPEKKEALKRAITMLEELRVQAALLLQAIAQPGIKTSVPELYALKTHLGVWQHIGFTQFLDLFYGPSDSPPGTNGSQTDAAGDLQARSMPPPKTSHKHRRITVEARWDTDNLFLVARFLTLCLLLSESKIAKVEPGPPFRVTVRPDLQSMYAEVEQELEALGLSPAQRNAKRCNGKQNLTKQSEAIQSYVSIISTDWMRQALLRLRLFDFHQSLSEGLVVANYRHISCIAAYASILLLRAAWLTWDTPLLVVITRFCSHGKYHNIYYRITRNPTDRTSSASSLREMGESHWFDVAHVSAQDMIALPWASQPHITMICMSGEGTTEDFRRRFLDSNLGKSCPSHNGTCREIANYINKLEGVNFARLLGHWFAQHDQFPFTLPDQKDGFERVFELMQRGLGQTAGDVFNEARDGADDFGTGRSMRVFTLEHVFSEFPGVVLKGLEENPLFYGCKLEF